RRWTTRRWCRTRPSAWGTWKAARIAAYGACRGWAADGRLAPRIADPRALPGAGGGLGRGAARRPAFAGDQGGAHGHPEPVRAWWLAEPGQLPGAAAHRQPRAWHVQQRARPARRGRQPRP